MFCVWKLKPSSQQRFVGFGESPRTRGRECQSRRREFFASLLAKKRLAELDEGRTVCRSKVMQADIVAGVQFNGAYSHCVHHSFLNLQKSIASVRAPLNQRMFVSQSVQCSPRGSKMAARKRR